MHFSWTTLLKAKFAMFKEAHDVIITVAVRQQSHPPTVAPGNSSHVLKQRAGHQYWHHGLANFCTEYKNYPAAFVFLLQSNAVMQTKENNGNQCGAMYGLALKG